MMLVGDLGKGIHYFGHTNAKNENKRHGLHLSNGGMCGLVKWLHAKEVLDFKPQTS